MWEGMVWRGCSNHDDDAFVPWDLSLPGCTEGAARATLSPAS